jgi:hypothetical protein
LIIALICPEDYVKLPTHTFLYRKCWLAHHGINTKSEPLLSSFWQKTKFDIEEQKSKAQLWLTHFFRPRMQRETASAPVASLRETAESLAKDMGHIGYEEGARQLETILKTSATLIGILESRFSKHELTYTRYKKPIDELVCALFVKLRKATDLYASMQAMNMDATRQELEELENLTSLEHADHIRHIALQNKREAWEKQAQCRAKLLVQNEEMLLSLNMLAGELAQLNPLGSPRHGNTNSAPEDIASLTEQVQMYECPTTVSRPG